jgi:hypothetical protein
LHVPAAPCKSTAPAAAHQPPDCPTTHHHDATPPTTQPIKEQTIHGTRERGKKKKKKKKRRRRRVKLEHSHQHGIRRATLHSNSYHAHHSDKLKKKIYKYVHIINEFQSINFE